MTTNIMKKNFIHYPVAAGILTISLLCTGSISNTSKAMSASVVNVSIATKAFTAANTSITPTTSNAANSTATPDFVNAIPATNSAISTPEPTDFETPNPNEIKIADILSLTKSKLLAKPGNTYYLTYNASATPNVRSSNKKTAIASLQRQKLKITIPTSAAKGSSATITLTLGSHKKTLLVIVENKVKKISYSKKQLTLKKRKNKRISIPIKNENNKKKTTDLIHVTSSKRSVATIKNCKVSAKKITFSIHSKQIGKTKIQIKAGNRKKTLICTVKEKKTIKKKQ